MTEEPKKTDTTSEETKTPPAPVEPQKTEIIRGGYVGDPQQPMRVTRDPSE